jgi:hypothetical protein
MIRELAVPLLSNYAVIPLDTNTMTRFESEPFPELTCATMAWMDYTSSKWQHFPLIRFQDSKVPFLPYLIHGPLRFLQEWKEKEGYLSSLPPLPLILFSYREYNPKVEKGNKAYSEIKMQLNVGKHAFPSTPGINHMIDWDIGAIEETMEERWVAVKAFAAILRLDVGIPCLQFWYRLDKKSK